MLEIALGIVIIVVCLACEGFFSGTETAIVSVDRTRMKVQAEKGSRRATMISAALDNPERFFSTTLLGTNMAAVLSNAVATFLVVSWLGERYEYVTILIMSPLILIFGEIVPKTVYRYHAEAIAYRIISPVRIVSLVLAPFVAVFTWLTRLFVKPFGVNSVQLRAHLTREDLENYLDMWNMISRLKTAEKKIIERIFDFSETDVADIMTPLINVKAVGIKDELRTAVALVKKTGHSRIPVYRDEAYNIVGILHSFDLIDAGDEVRTPEEIMRPARYVPESLPIDDLLDQLRTEGHSMAVVVNEYGGTVGVVTLEDILEEIVGEIYDEYDREESLMVKVGKNRYLVNALMEINDLNERLKLDLPKDDYETLAGFLLKHMERIPEAGESCRYGPAKFTVKQADKRSIKQVFISIADAEPGPAARNDRKP